MNAPMPDRSYYCPGNSAKQAQSRAMRRFYKAASKQLPGFQFETHFNPGGPAVWGETYAKLYLNDRPVIEAYDTHMGILVRQWDGRNSGHNNYVQTLEQFVLSGKWRLLCLILTLSRQNQ